VRSLLGTEHVVSNCSLSLERNMSSNGLVPFLFGDSYEHEEFFAW